MINNSEILTSKEKALQKLKEICQNLQVEVTLCSNYSSRINTYPNAIILMYRKVGENNADREWKVFAAFVDPVQGFRMFESIESEVSPVRLCIANNQVEILG